MRTVLKLLAAAAAFGLAPAALAQTASVPMPETPTAATTNAGAPAVPPQAELPAQPQEVSDPALANPGRGEPTNAQVAATAAAARTAPRVGIGQPDGRMHLQDQFTPIGEEAAWFHNWILMPAITFITLFVLALLAWVILRYRRSANPVPSRTSHNTVLEVVWTLVPVLVLVVIAVPSIRLLAHQYSAPRADVTVKVIGNQWYWQYEYPDHGIEVISNILSDADAQASNEPRLLAVDERMVVPAGATVKLIVTSNDVIHSWGVPSFWVKMDAVPGRLNETWFRTEQPGLYYGNCYELCGARHAYMPIAVDVVPPAQFAAWVASKGGTMPGTAPAQPAAAAPANPQQPGLTAGEATPVSPAPAGVVDATTTAPVTNQSAASSTTGNQ